MFLATPSYENWLISESSSILQLWIGRMEVKDLPIHTKLAQKKADLVLSMTTKEQRPKDRQMAR